MNPAYAIAGAIGAYLLAQKAKAGQAIAPSTDAGTGSADTSAIATAPQAVTERGGAASVVGAEGGKVTVPSTSQPEQVPTDPRTSAPTTGTCCTKMGCGPCSGMATATAPASADPVASKAGATGIVGVDTVATGVKSAVSGLNWAYESVVSAYAGVPKSVTGAELATVGPKTGAVW